MANYLCIFPTPDAHIDYIKANPESLYAYVDGERPVATHVDTPKLGLWQRITGKAPVAPPVLQEPSDWPTTEATMIGPEINHRNADLYHLILNGKPDFVAGSGSIFQTWLQSANDSTHSAIDLTGDNEHFAFYSKQLPELAALTATIDAATILDRFTQWLRSNSDDYTPTDDECAAIAKEFSAFTMSLQEAISKSDGLIWVSS